MFIRIQNILFALEKLTKDVSNPASELYSTIESLKIKDATELINEVVEKLRKK